LKEERTNEEASCANPDLALTHPNLLNAVLLSNFTYYLK
jgi:hypothetical protein